MLDRYINIKDRVITAGQTSGGIWYIKELPVESMKELEKLMGEANRICNKYNKKGVSPRNPPLPKNKPKVKGLE